MHSLEGILSEHPFFQGLDEEYRRLIVGCASNVRFDAAEFLFLEGEQANHFYVIRHGSVALEVDVPGRGPITVQTLHPGDVAGWSWLFPPYRWHFDARAVEPVRAIALDGACLRGKCDEDPRLGYELFKRFAHIMVDRLQATALQLADVYGRS